jgi:hypothetical protein
MGLSTPQVREENQIHSSMTMDCRSINGKLDTHTYLSPAAQTQCPLLRCPCCQWPYNCGRKCLIQPVIPLLEGDRIEAVLFYLLTVIILFLWCWGLTQGPEQAR